MRTHRWNLVTTALAVLFLGCAGTAGAQEAGPDDEEAEVVVEVDGDGRVFVDGEEVTSDSARVVVRVRPDGSGLAADRRARVHVVRPAIPRPEAPPRPRRMREFMLDFEPPDVPPIAPLVEEFTTDMHGSFSALIQEHREVAQLERESRQLAAEARRAEGDDRAALEAQLRAKLDEIFERKLELRRERAQQLQERLEEQRAEIDERASARADIIERRYRELLGESDALDW